MAAYISRTLASNGEYKLTISMWVKLAKVQEQDLMTAYSSGSLWASLRYGSNGTLRFQDYRSGYLLNMITNAQYKDTNAWYHIVANYDASLATPTAKLYVNGEEPSLSSSVKYSQNPTTSWGSAYTFRIGEGSSLGGNDFEGVMSDVYFIQGYTYDASTFGETDSTTGEWKPILNPTINYGGTGGNSCHLKFENSANMDLDSGDNNLTFTTSGTLTQTEDNPSNNFATWNKLNFGRYGTSVALPTFTYGNTRVKFTDGTSDQFCSSTFPITEGGNYYWEVKLSASPNSGHIGIYDAPNYNTGTPNNATGTYIYRYNGTKVVNGAAPTSYGDTYTNGDIIGFAFNGTSGTLWASKNGVWQNSATQSEIEAGTTTNSLATGIDTTKDLFPYIQDYNNSQYDANFGNGYFAGTAISSEGTNASGIGKFEYDVPTGYTALSTRGLNE